MHDLLDGDPGGKGAAVVLVVQRLLLHPALKLTVYPNTNTFGDNNKTGKSGVK